MIVLHDVRHLDTEEEHEPGPVDPDQAQRHGRHSAVDTGVLGHGKAAYVGGEAKLGELECNGVDRSADQGGPDTVGGNWT